MSRDTPFLPFATSVLADALRSGQGQRTAVAFYGIAFGVTAPAFNAVWQYARRHGLLSEALGAAGATAIGRRFQLALAWLATGALLGAVLPVLAVAVIVAFNAFYWLPIRGESPAGEPEQTSAYHPQPAARRGRGCPRGRDAARHAPGHRLIAPDQDRHHRRYRGLAPPERRAAYGA